MTRSRADGEPPPGPAGSRHDNQPPALGSRAPRLVLGLGNPILRDDAVGLRVAQRVRALLTPEQSRDVEVQEAEVAGFGLLDRLMDRSFVVIVDALQREDLPPGTLLLQSPSDYTPTPRLTTAHQVDLPTALGLGEPLGLAMPSVVHILGVVVEDPETFGETMTPAVAAAVELAAGRVLSLLRQSSVTPGLDAPNLA